MPKPKIGIYWCASCGGCEETVVELAEDILAVVEAVDIVLWPVAMDTKYADVKAMQDRHIDVCFFNGSVRNSEQEELAHLLRKKSKVLVAFGSCTGFSGGAVSPHDFYPCIDVSGSKRNYFKLG